MDALKAPDHSHADAAPRAPTVHEHGRERPAMWTVQDVAAYLKVSRSWVYKAAESGDIPCRRIGALLRFSPARIEEWAMDVSVNATARRAANTRG